MAKTGECAAPPDAMFGHREVVLEKTDDGPSWGPGHAEWHCLACGRRAERHAVLSAHPCETKP